MMIGILGLFVLLLCNHFFLHRSICSVFKRLVTLIADHARITASSEASLAQAKSATEAAQRLMSTTPTARDGDSEVCFKKRLEQSFFLPHAL